MSKPLLPDAVDSAADSEGALEGTGDGTGEAGAGDFAGGEPLPPVFGAAVLAPGWSSCSRRRSNAARRGISTSRSSAISRWNLGSGDQRNPSSIRVRTSRLRSRSSSLKRPREFGEPLALLRPLQEVGPVGRHLNHRQIPQVVHEQGDEVLQIPAFAHEFLDDFEDRPAVSFDDRYAGAAADLHVRNPDHLTDILGS